MAERFLSLVKWVARGFQGCERGGENENKKTEGGPGARPQNADRPSARGCVTDVTDITDVTDVTDVTYSRPGTGRGLGDHRGHLT